jgi:hypothetical protein
MLELLLGIIAILLFLIYKKINSFVGDKSDSEPLEGNIKGWVRSLNSNLWEIVKNTSQIADYFNYENPAGKKSNKYKKQENLIKIYTQYLIETKKLNEKDALIRARFEVTKFGEEKVIDEIDEDFSNGTYWKEKRKAEQDYYDSNLIQKDIKSFYNYTVKGELKVTPYELMARIYDVLIKQDYGNDKCLILAWFRNEDNYRSFIENRACIYQLEKIGVIKKINKDGLGGKPKWIITTTDLEKLKKIIYEGGASHDNDFFEERYNKGELPRIFNVSELLDS